MSNLLRNWVHLLKYCIHDPKTVAFLSLSIGIIDFCWVYVGYIGLEDLCKICYKGTFSFSWVVHAGISEKCSVSWVCLVCIWFEWWNFGFLWTLGLKWWFNDYFVATEFLMSFLQKLRAALILIMWFLIYDIIFKVY